MVSDNVQSARTSVPTTALLIVDVQRDYLERDGLVPDEAALLGSIRLLLEGFRTAHAAIAHVRTVVKADGSDAMPHWRDCLRCVAGTPGAEAPPSLQEQAAEYVAHKQYYSGFADAGLTAWLRGHGVERVIIAGLYEHACVRETALDAYQQGFDVVIASDAVGTDSPEHAGVSRSWLEARAATYMSVEEILHHLPGVGAPSPALAVSAAVEAATRAQVAWQARPLDVRLALLSGWADELQGRSDDLQSCITREVRKPIAMAADEVRRAIAHAQVAIALASGPAATEEHIDRGVRVRHRPQGVIGLLMPWNNPIALPCAKIASALSLGNAVVFKPSPLAEASARLLMETLKAAGIPTDLVHLVTGGAEVGARVVHDPGVAAIAVTGSIDTGRAIAAECARLGKPLQAELGGNNAAIVLADADLDAVVPALIRNAFAYSGQRCTAVRRFVVEETILDVFLRCAVRATEALNLGDADDPAADVGPVISGDSGRRIAGEVQQAISAGAQLLTGGCAVLDAGDDDFLPTLLMTTDAQSRIVQEETFGPVAVVQPAIDLKHAIELANDVAQGLVMFVCTSDPRAAAQVMEHAQVGVVQWGPGILPVHADAPFGGWKASGFGPPEHGVWDLQFFTRPQAVYEEP